MLIVAHFICTTTVGFWGFGHDTPPAKIFMHKLSVKNCVDDVFVNLLCSLNKLCRCARTSKRRPFRIALDPCAQHEMNENFISWRSSLILFSIFVFISFAYITRTLNDGSTEESFDASSGAMSESEWGNWQWWWMDNIYSIDDIECLRFTCSSSFDLNRKHNNLLRKLLNQYLFICDGIVEIKTKRFIDLHRCATDSAVHVLFIQIRHGRCPSSYIPWHGFWCE